MNEGHVSYEIHERTWEERRKSWEEQGRHFGTVNMTGKRKIGTVFNFFGIMYIIDVLSDIIFT